MRPLHPSAHAAAWIVLFTVALSVGLAIHLGHPVARRLVATSVNRTLASVLVGRVTIDRIGSLSLTHIDDLDAHVDAPDGSPVLQVDGIRARVSTWVLLRRLILSRGAVVVDVPELAIGKVDVAVDAQPNGAPRIASAFTLRAPSPTDASRPGLRLHLRHVRIGHATFHALPSAPVEGDIDGLEGSLGLVSGVVAIEVVRGRLTVALPGSAQALGDVEGHMTAPKLRAHVHWTGQVGPVAAVLDVGYDNDRVDASLDTARATPEQLRAVWPSCPLSDSAELHVEVHGTPPRLDAAAHGVLGAGVVDIAGPLDVGPELHAALRVNATALDLHAIVPSAPCSALSASGQLSISATPSGTIQARTALDFEGGDLGAYRLPAAAITADATIPPRGLPSANAEVHVREAGAPGTFVLHLVPKRGSVELSFEGDAQIPRLEKVTRLGGLASGSARLTTAGTIDFGTNVLSGRLSTTFENVEARGIAISAARAEVHASGKLSAPVFDVQVDGDRLGAPPLRLSAFRASGRLTVDQGLTVHDAEADVAAAGPAVHASAALVRVTSEGVTVDDAVVEGLGAPLTVSVRTSSASVVVKAKSAGVELGPVAAFVSVPVTRGGAAVDIDVAVGAGAAEGRVAIDVVHAALFGVADASARVEGTVHGRRMAGHATASVEDIGTFEASSSALDVGPGKLTTASPWRRTWGGLDFAAHVDLSRLAAKLPAAALAAFGEVAGTVDLQGRVARDAGDDDSPDVDFTLRTQGLELVARRAAGVVRIHSIDPVLHVTVDGDTGHTDLVAQLLDPSGTLVTLRAASNAVPYAKLFSDANPAPAFRAMPFDADLEVSPRRIDMLPPVLRPPGMDGELAGKVSWHGAASLPSIDAEVSLKGATDPAVLAVPVDVGVNAHYDGVRLQAAVQGAARDKRVLDAVATLDARAVDLLSGGEIPWKASARVTLDQAPLRSVGYLADHEVHGTVSGELALEGLHDDAQLHAAVTFDKLQVGDASYKSASAKLAIDGHALDGSIRLDQVDGFLETRAHFGSRWGRDLVPSIDASVPGMASLSAKQLRAAILLPFLAGSFSSLDGRIDANATLQIDAGAKGVRPQGTVSLNNGTFEMARFGTEFHDARATLTLTPDGVVKLQDAVAHGVSGSVEAAASARFDGLGLTGARATLQMPAKDPLPLVFDGIQMGALDGRIDLAADRVGQGLNVDVNVPAAHVQLPTGSTSLDVQQLGDVDGVQVGVRRSASEFVPISLDASREEHGDRAAQRKAPTRIAVKLGSDVHVSRGADLDVRLEGQPTITLTDETTVSGQIRMPPGGSIEVQGQRFEIQNGSVTFVGPDPSDPQVVLTAGWTAPDGTRVYADFIGPLKSAQVKLRSDPERSQTQILALLLSGEPGDAAGAAGGVATQQLNQALGGINRALHNLGLAGGISTKVDTSQINPRPEVEVQIARDISLQVAWIIGAPPPGTNPDTALLTLNWHFLRKWSLETTLGDQGTSIFDVVWQHRY